MGLNHITLMGRLTADPEVRSTQTGVSVTSFTVAVDDDYKGANGDKVTNFIDCVAWRQTADFIGKYFGKGRLIAVEGSLITRSYEDSDGKRRKVSEVRVDRVYFAGDKKDTQSPAADQKAPDPVNDFDDYEEILSDNGVPF